MSRHPNSCSITALLRPTEWRTAVVRIAAKFMNRITWRSSGRSIASNWHLRPKLQRHCRPRLQTRQIMENERQLRLKTVGRKSCVDSHHIERRTLSHKHSQGTAKTKRASSSPSCSTRSCSSSARRPSSSAVGIVRIRTRCNLSGFGLQGCW